MTVDDVKVKHVKLHKKGMIKYVSEMYQYEKIKL